MASYSFLYTQSKSKEEGYLIFNGVSLILVILMLIYPLLSQLLNAGFTCEYKLLFGRECRSCGLTRGLVQCWKGKFITGNTFNPQSAFVFFSIIFQLIFRTTTLIYFTVCKNVLTNILLPFVTCDIGIIIFLLLINIYYYG